MKNKTNEKERKDKAKKKRENMKGKKSVKKDQ